MHKQALRRISKRVQETFRQENLLPFPKLRNQKANNQIFHIRKSGEAGERLPLRNFRPH